MRWLIIVVVVVVAAFFGYRYFYTDQGQDLAQQVGEAATEATEEVEQATEEVAEEAEAVTDQADDTAQQAAESAQDATAALTVDGVNLGQEVGTTVSDAVGALQGITDKASAEAALPSLEAVKTKLDELGGTVEKLPAQAHEALASLLGDSLPELQELVTKVEGIEGVGPVVKPTLDSIMATLDGWAKQPA